MDEISRRKRGNREYGRRDSFRPTGTLRRWDRCRLTSPFHGLGTGIAPDLTFGRVLPRHGLPRLLYRKYLKLPLGFTHRYKPRPLSLLSGVFLSRPLPSAFNFSVPLFLSSLFVHVLFPDFWVYRDLSLPTGDKGHTDLRILGQKVRLV